MSSSTDSLTPGSCAALAKGDNYTILVAGPQVRVESFVELRGEQAFQTCGFAVGARAMVTDGQTTAEVYFPVESDLNLWVHADVDGHPQTAYHAVHPRAVFKIQRMLRLPHPHNGGSFVLVHDIELVDDEPDLKMTDMDTMEAKYIALMTLVGDKHGATAVEKLEEFITNFTALSEAAAAGAMAA